MVAQPASSPTALQITLCPKRDAILRIDGHLLVKGGPGSGKTTIALLKARARMNALEPGQEILFLSFSRAAVRQVLSRCKQLLKPRERALLTVKTYHAFCMEVLRSHGRLLSGKTARFLAPDEERLAKSEFNGDWDAELRRRALMEGVFAFDLFAPAVAELFTRARAVRTLYADKYPLIVVDEFQDTDDDQWRIVRALAEDTAMFALADPEQRIFDYRPNVSATRLDEFRAALAPTEFDLADDNHRSPGSGILQFADAVLHSRPLPETKDVVQLAYAGKAFPSMVHAGVVWTLGHLRKRGVEDPSVAVLCRTNHLVAQVSGILNEEHTFKEHPLRPIPHVTCPPETGRI
jgi:DNA helicase-2/ATP-dependent DNA helicase PcrA